MFKAYFDEEGKIRREVDIFGRISIKSDLNGGIKELIMDPDGNQIMEKVPLPKNDGLLVKRFAGGESELEMRVGTSGLTLSALASNGSVIGYEMKDGKLVLTPAVSDKLGERIQKNKFK